MAGRLTGASSLLMVNFIISKSCIGDMNAHVRVCVSTCKAVNLLMLCKDAILACVAHVAKCGCPGTDVALKHRDAVFIVDILRNTLYVISRCA